MEKKKLITTTVTLDGELLAEITALCKELDTDRSKFVRQAVRYYIKAMTSAGGSGGPVGILITNKHKNTVTVAT